jgi:hypothetical protein
VIALHKGTHPGPFAYLQGIRSGALKALNPDPEKTEVADAYHRKEHQYSKKLAEAVPGPVDAIVSPPSSLAWQAKPYRDAIAAAHPNALDLTSGFSRTGDARAGRKACLSEVFESFAYSASGRETEFRRIVVVDDTFSTGTTTAAIITHMRHCGLPESCEVIVACPLWLDT